MSLNISGIGPLPLLPDTAARSLPSAGSGEFRDVLQGAIDQVESSRSAAAQSVDHFLAGEGDDLHSTILAVQRADLEFEMLMQMRNKVVSAYQEVMRMQM
jgi:flagellar hook-basal body complex protein FliE